MRRALLEDVMKIVVMVEEVANQEVANQVVAQQEVAMEEVIRNKNSKVEREQQMRGEI